MIKLIAVHFVRFHNTSETSDNMKIFKAKTFIYAISLTLILSSLLCFSACKKEPEETPKTPAEMSYEEFVAFFLPEYISENLGVVYENSCIDYNLFFDDKLEKSGEDKTEYYKNASDRLGKPINNYIEQVSAESEETLNLLKTQFGNDYQITYTISNDNHFSEEDCQKICMLLVVGFESEGYASSRYINPSKLTDAHEITFDYTIKGTKGETGGSDTILLLQYNGRWVYGEIEI